MSTEPDGCGCPPTARSNGAIHHLIINVTDLERSRAFYDWLMPRVGYPGRNDYGFTVGYYGDGGSFWVQATRPEFAGDSFHRHRVGLCEIAFRADDRAQIDALHRDLVARGVPILDPPQEYQYVAGYYAVFFTDPDGMKLELLHIPG